jgi:Uma2 family endonuclease
MDPALPNEGSDPRMTVEQYFALADEGVLEPDDRVELLDGVVVSMAPRNPPHDGNTARIAKALRREAGDRALVREEKTLILGRHSVPEPDVAVVPLDPLEYTESHPTTAYLVVEVAHSSLPQDRLSKSRIYGGAGIPEYWILNLRDGRVEIRRHPDVSRRTYTETTIADPDTRLDVLALPGVSVLVRDLLPPRRAR